MKRYTLFILFSLFIAVLQAQTTTTYYCDFEDDQENAQWTLNAGSRGPDGLNQWHIDAAGSFGIGSTKGLYIADEQNSPDKCSYYATNYACFQAAYRTLTLTPGTYTIQFDWKGLGQPNDEMLIFWTNSNVGSNSNPTDISIPTSINGIANAIKVRGKANWQSYTGSLTVGQSGGKLVVMWYNKAGVATNPGGAIDNIRIYQGTACDAPTTIGYNLNSKLLNWGGKPGDTYDVLVYNYQTANYSSYSDVTQNQMTIPSLTEEGMYYFYVRTNCGDELHTSDWISCNQFVWIPGARCLDFMDLDGAKCYRGPFEDVTGSRETVVRKEDYGYESVNSFHTIHYVPGERDPRTRNQLTTTPAGEVASVRLGNWRADDPEGEAIEYKYQVRAGMSDIMEIQYAVVMEKPAHGQNDDPHFTLEILDQQGKQIGGAQASCFKADFAAASYDPAHPMGWKLIPSAQMQGVEGVSNTDILWKDWTLISVSLRNYIGQTLTIRMTTKDCAFAYHWAYAYFTIGCRGGDLQGIACGDYSTDHFDAPEGFDYRWYWEGNPSKVLGTNSRFDITSTTDSIYIVDVISKTAGGCYYSLTANPNPRYPKAEGYVMNQKPSNCQNKVTIKNDSRVYFINRKTGESMPTQETAAVESMTWDWGDGSPKEENNDDQVSHVFPETGGTFRVMGVASMSGGVCTDTIYHDIVLPDITANATDEEINLCREETPSYRLPDGKVVTKDTTYITQVPNQYGCSVDKRHVVLFHDSVLSVKDTTFCEGGYINFAGKKYTETGSYKVPLKTIHGCDSTLELNLTVIPRLEIAVEPIYTVCGDGVLNIPFDILKGRYNGVTVHLADSSYWFDADEEISIPMYNENTDTYLRPKLYEAILELGTPDCPADPVHVVVEVNYASFIMYQKHGFIGLLNPEYNTYGDTFDTRYAWYCNNELMPEDTLSYIRVKDDDWGKEYRVEVIRIEDGVVMKSCPLTYTFGMQQGLNGLFADEKVIAYYDVLGRRYATLPQQKGVYVVVFSQHAEKIVVE